MGDFVMGKYEEGIKVIEEMCGNGKDNVIALSTISAELGNGGNPRPSVRDVNAYYSDGVFYVTTWGESNKMRQISKNNEVAFSVNFGGFYGNAIGENLGWVLEPKNAELRAKLREVFSEWYDIANNENDKNCVILAIKITSATLNINHGAFYANMDFVNKVVV